MTEEPPLSAPSVQLRPIYDPVVIDGTLARFKGASGDVSIIAPLPGVEKPVVPMMFVAEILAQMEVPQVMLKGEAKSTLTGTTQLLAETIDELVPLQLTRSKL